MGNELDSAKSRLTDEQFPTYLELLRRVTEKLLMKRNVDLAVFSGDKLREKDVDIYPNGSGKKVLARVRPYKSLDSEELDVPRSPEEYDTNVSFNGPMMDSNPKQWTVGQILAAQKVLEDYKREKGLDGVPRVTIKGNSNLVRSLAIASNNVWSRYAISVVDRVADVLKDTEERVVDDKAVVIINKSAANVKGRILPDKQRLEKGTPVTRSTLSKVVTTDTVETVDQSKLPTK